MILFFTQLRPDRPLYRQDILNAACFAKDEELKLSYRERHFASATNTTDMRDCDALIIFDEYQPDERQHAKPKETDDHADWDAWARATYTFHPLRFARVKSVQEEDEYRHVTLTLSDFPQPQGDAIAKLREEILATGEHPARHRKHARFARRLPDDSERGWVAALRGGRWAAHVSRLATLEGLSDCTFFTCQHPSGDDAEPRPLLDACKHRGEFRLLESGKCITVSLHVIWGRKRDHALPKLIVEDDLGRVVGPFRHQRGEGESLSYKLFVERPMDEVTGLVAASVANEDGARCNSPMFQAIARIERRWILLTIVVVLFAAGTLLGSGKIGSGDDVYLYMTAGTLFTAIAAFLGFAKLRLKG
jgi:hypothetical protein